MAARQRISVLQRPIHARTVVLAAGIVLGVGYLLMIRMPGTSYRGLLPQLTEQELTFRTWLRRDVETLAGHIGERNLSQYAQLQQAAAFIAAELGKAGYTVGRQSYQVEGRPCENLEVELPGSGHAEEIVIIGAHYDSVFGSPGANDNASGVAALLTIARAGGDPAGADAAVCGVRQRGAVLLPDRLDGESRVRAAKSGAS